MSRADDYRSILRKIENWVPYLLKESGLPGPRGNIELAQVVAEKGSRQQFQDYISYTSDRAPVNSPYEFLAFCGVLGFGRLLAEGDHSLLGMIRGFASDPRWRLREAVAMALQKLGDADMDQLIAYMKEWADGTMLEQRAAAAALCEPRLLKSSDHANSVLSILDRITSSVGQVPDRSDLNFRALRKGLGYCWSVAVVALPGQGKAMMERWMIQPDRDIRWIMNENLKKARLTRMDEAWVRKCRNLLNG